MGFAQHIDYPLGNSTVGTAGYTAGSGTFAMFTGGGANFPTPTTTNPVRITLASQANPASCTSFSATGLTGDTFTGMTLLNGNQVDRNYVSGDFVFSSVYAEDINDLQNAGYLTAIPNPSPSSLGGVESVAPVAHQWINSISTAGTPAQSQPAFTDISGAATVAQLPTGIPNANLATLAASSLMGNPTGSSAVPEGITLGANLSFSGTTLVAAGSSGANALGTYIVQTATNAPANAQVLASLTTGLAKITTGTGAISIGLAGTDYVTPSGNITGTSSNVTGTVTPAHGGTGLATLTANAVMLGEGTSNVGFATIGTAGRVLVDQGAALDPGFKAVSGDATLNSTGVLTVGAGAITLAKQANFAASSLMGNPTGSAATPSAITLGANLSFSGTTLVAAGGSGGTPGGTSGQIQYNNASAFGGFTMSGDATIVPSTGVITVSPGAITLAKHANLAASSLMGNPTGSSATPSAITLGSGLSFSGTTLTATGGGGSGTVTNVSSVPNQGVTLGITSPTTAPVITPVLGNITPTQVTIQSGTGVDLFSLNAATAPAAQAGTVVQVVNADTVATRIEADAIGAAAFLSLVRSGGVSGTLSALTSGTEIGGTNAFGYNGTTVVGPRAGVGFFANENWSGTNQGTYTQLTATPNGSTTQQQVLQANGSGGILIPGSVTGGDMGPGTINAAQYWVNGMLLGYPLFKCGACTAVTASTITSLLGSPANSKGSLTIPGLTFVEFGQELVIDFKGILSTGTTGPTPLYAVSLGGTNILVGQVTAAQTTSLTGKEWGPLALRMMVTNTGASGAIGGVSQIEHLASATAAQVALMTSAAAGGGTPTTIDFTSPQALDFKITIGQTGCSFQILALNIYTR